MLRRRKLMRQEGTSGTRNRDVKEQLQLGNEGQPEESTGSPLDWKSRSELPDVLLATKNKRLDLVEGSTPSKKTAHTTGAGNVEAPAPTTTERRIVRALSGAAREERT
jgi:hypothetical protein